MFYFNDTNLVNISRNRVFTQNIIFYKIVRIKYHSSETYNKIFFSYQELYTINISINRILQKVFL